MKILPYPVDYQGSATHDTSVSFAARMEERLRHAKAIGQQHVSLVTCSICGGCGCRACNNKGYWVQE